MPNIAPVCNVRPQAPAARPSLSPLPAIPNPTNLESAITAINMLKQIITIIFNQLPNNNVDGLNGANFLSGGGNLGGIGVPSRGGGSSVGNGFKGYPESSFFEIPTARIYKTTRIFGMTDGKKDKDVWVDVKQITGLTFFDKITDQFWVWKQGNGGTNGNSSNL